MEFEPLPNSLTNFNFPQCPRHSSFPTLRLFVSCYSFFSSLIPITSSHMNIGYIYVFNNKKPFLTTKDILLSLNINDPLCAAVTITIIAT